MANAIQDGDQLHAFQGKQTAMTVNTCEGCNMQGHKLDNCDPFVNHIMGDNLMKKKPEIASSVWKKIQQFHHHRITQRRTGYRPPPGKTINAIQDDKPELVHQDQAPTPKQDEEQDLQVNSRPPSNDQELDITDLLHAIIREQDFWPGQEATQL